MVDTTNFYIHTLHTNCQITRRPWQTLQGGTSTLVLGDTRLVRRFGNIVMIYVSLIVTYRYACMYYCIQVSYFNTAPVSGSLRDDSVNLNYHLTQCAQIFGKKMFPGPFRCLC